MDRLIEETLHSLPHVFVDTALDAVKQELSALGDLASRFRATSKVGNFEPPLASRAEYPL